LHFWLIRQRTDANDPDGADMTRFEVIATDEQGDKPTHALWAKCGPGDEGEPVITILCIGED